MNWIDAIIILIVLIFVIIGCYKGFIFSILSLFSFFVNFSIALFITKPLNSLLSSWFGLEGALSNSLSNKITSMHTGFSTNLVGLGEKELSSHISKTLASSDFPFKNMFKYMLDITPAKLEGKTSATLGDILSKSLGSFFSLIISFIIAFGLIYLILFIISLLSKKAKEVNGIRITDRILGVIFGLVKGSLVVVSLFAILAFFNEGGVLEPVFEYISTSKMSSWIYSNINTLVDKYITLDNIKSITS